MTTRQAYSLEQIKDLLLARIEDVVERYAPPVAGSYRAHGRYFTLNPGRVDRHVGSFYVQMRGSKPGQWVDHATGQFGDVLDLIALSLATDLRGAMSEARAFLGLETASPEDLARRRTAARAAAERRRQAAADERRAEERRRRSAQALFLSAREGLRGTPVESYLRDTRAVDLAALGRQPRALRFAPECRYYREDRETGEVIEAVYPAMLAAIYRGRDFIGVHRTYLARDPATNGWSKAPLPDAKKVLGDVRGGGINLWRGIGPRGGKPAPLSASPPGTELYIAEGIEDALSVVMLLPEARVLAAISLGNLGQVTLPETVSTVTLVADLDEAGQAQEQLQRAVAQHRAAGRVVRLWQNPFGGKDLNDALRAVRRDRADEEKETSDE